jgi:hypothetical protein
MTAQLAATAAASIIIALVIVAIIEPATGIRPITWRGAALAGSWLAVVTAGTVVNAWYGLVPGTLTITVGITVTGLVLADRNDRNRGRNRGQ